MQSIPQFCKLVSHLIHRHTIYFQFPLWKHSLLSMIFNAGNCVRASKLAEWALFRATLYPSHSPHWFPTHIKCPSVYIYKFFKISSKDINTLIGLCWIITPFDTCLKLNDFVWMLCIIKLINAMFFESISVIICTHPMKS